VAFFRQCLLQMRHDPRVPPPPSSPNAASDSTASFDVGQPQGLPAPWSSTGLPQICTLGLAAESKETLFSSLALTRSEISSRSPDGRGRRRRLTVTSTEPRTVLQGKSGLRIAPP